MALDKHVESLTFLTRRAWFLRIDVTPFAVLYATAFAWAYGVARDQQLPALVALSSLLLAQVLVFFSTQWTAHADAVVGYTKARSVQAATHVLVQPASKQRSAKIVKLRKHQQPAGASATVVGREFALPACWFVFQKLTYCYRSENDFFSLLEYPTDAPIERYLQWEGHSVEGAAVAGRLWGRCMFDIPMPSFLELFKDHLVAPFFLFQVFCLVLWSLDEYWYYSGMTLCMLLLFEGMQCYQRQNSLEMLRAMRRSRYPIQVYRDRHWLQVSTEDLVPGDIVSLRTPQPLGGLPFLRQRRRCADGDIAFHSPASTEEYLVPCDAVLLRGTCVVNESMLTGESVPQMKEGATVADDQLAVVGGQVVDPLVRRHIVYGGTQVIQHSHENGIEAQAPTAARTASIPVPPDQGCPAVVLRTGFATTQGELMRTILFASETVNAHAQESLVFIVVLLMFAIFASAYVLNEGLKSETRNKFKLVLHCIMIVTSVVPPELPMELSMAVTNSLAALTKLFIYCTEPFRIPFAGRVTICCFDKTGTLTQDKMLFRGMVNEAGEVANGITGVASNVVATCHSLVMINRTFRGDPIEKAAIETISCRSDGQNTVVVQDGGRSTTFTIRHRYAFSAALKRMSVLVQDSQQKSLRVFTKGAPETIQSLLATVPPQYTELYKRHMLEGKRVLALAERTIPAEIGLEQIRSWSRADIEQNLKFVAFLLFDSELKPESCEVIQDLHESSHTTIMITGDSVLTAIEVARRLNMVSSDISTTLVLNNTQSAGLLWLPIDVDHSKSRPLPFSVREACALAKQYDLCMSGEAVDHLAQRHSASELAKVFPHIKVFARVSPEQKEFILLTLRHAGHTTLMCGDGTNDVGALKQAHVGVSIVNNQELEEAVERSTSQILAANRVTPDKQNPAVTRLIRMRQELAVQDSDPTLVKLGDASIASPFTARRTSIECVLAVLRQGRCTLVTTLQIFKILALNCLISAYMMSVLYILGLKQGDSQMTCMGLIVAALFFCLSRAEPLPKLSKQRPPASVFAIPVVASIVGQFAVHLLCLQATLSLCAPHIDPDDPSMTPDGEFRPNTINTAVFLITAMMQLNNFVVNYRGHPFMQGLTENKALWYCMQALYPTIMIATLGWFEPLNEFLQLVPMPSVEFSYKLLAVLIGNLVGLLVVERSSQFFEAT